MATHDYDIANQSGSLFRSDLNSVLSAIVSNNSSASAPSTTFAYMWWADTTSGWLKQRNSANTAWIKILLLSTAAGTRETVQSKGSNYTVVETDFASFIRLTSSITLTLTSVSSLESGFWFDVRNDFTSPAIISPSSTNQTIDGATSMVVNPGDSFRLLGTGSIWHTFRGASTYLKDDGATAGPYLRVFRDSASPAANDALGVIAFDGRDSGGAIQQYANIYGNIETNSAATESGQFIIGTVGAGTLADRFVVGRGLYASGLTDAGSRTVNATGYYVSGSNLSMTHLNTYTSGQFPVNSNGLTTHGLGAIPSMLYGVLKCQSNDMGYVPGDEIPLNSVCDTGTTNLQHLWCDATNVAYSTGGGNIRIAHKTAVGSVANLTTGSWRILFRAWK